jgi:transposase InsO family protein
MRRDYGCRRAGLREIARAHGCSRDTVREVRGAIGRKHVATLMRKMGIEAIYRRANTSRQHPRHVIYPNLLRNLTIDRPNQVWATDVTYIPMARGCASARRTQQQRALYPRTADGVRGFS